MRQNDNPMNAGQKGFPHSFGWLVQYLTILLVVPWGYAQPTSKLDELQVMYQESVAKLDGLQKEAYQKLLMDTATQAKDKGDLDGYLLVDAERKRFAHESTIPATNVLSEAQGKLFEKIVQDHESRNIELHRRYVYALDGLIKRLMADDMIQEAIDVKRERERAVYMLSLLEPGDSNLGSAKGVGLKPAGRKMENIAKGAKVEVNRSAQAAFSDPEQVVDGDIRDVGKNGRFYWFGGEGSPKPDWIRLVFPQAVEVHEVRMLVPIDDKRFPGNGHEPLDYELCGLQRGVKTTLAKVENGKHIRIEPGPIESVRWAIVKLPKPQTMDGIQLTVSRTSGANMGPVVFEIEALTVTSEKK